MGCCQSTEDIEGRQRSDEIDSQLKRDRMNMKSEIKMLLLGKSSAFTYSVFIIVSKHIHFLIQARVNPANQPY